MEEKGDGFRPPDLDWGFWKFRIPIRFAMLVGSPEVSDQWTMYSCAAEHQ